MGGLSDRVRGHVAFLHRGRRSSFLRAKGSLYRLVGSCSIPSLDERVV